MKGKLRPVNELIIRTANQTDIPNITKYNVALAFETEEKNLDIDLVTAGVRAVINSSSRGIYYIAEMDTAVIGQLMITTEWSDWRNGFFWWIQSVYIQSSWRRKGVFKALYRHVESLARKNPEVCGLRLDVAQENHRAQMTYRNLGMKQIPYFLFEVESQGSI